MRNELRLVSLVVVLAGFAGMATARDSGSEGGDPGCGVCSPGPGAGDDDVVIEIPDTEERFPIPDVEPVIELWLGGSPDFDERLSWTEGSPDGDDQGPPRRK